ncbi:MAG: NAD(P)-dependent oxidoreductase [Candidatus Gracilibacteria bacterium]
MDNLGHAFRQGFEVDQFPIPPNVIAFTDGVSRAGIDLADRLGFKPLDLIEADIGLALREVKERRIGAILGRGGMDGALEHGEIEDFQSLPNLVVRLGNGVGMERQIPFKLGKIIARTPRGNAEAVRIFQDLAILGILQKLDRVRGIDCENNPALQDDVLVKNGGVKKLNWDRAQVSERVNPGSLSKAEMTADHLQMADVFAGKKVAVIGLGRIGMEAILKSPFLQGADVHAYDPNNKSSVNGSKVADSLDEVLSGAELVLLHLDGNRELIGDEQLKLLESGAIVCNMARGKVVNPKALYQAIKDGRIAGACLDTHFVEGKALQDFGKEEDPDKWESGDYAVVLRKLPQVVATNHSAASDETAQRVNVEDGVRAAIDYLTLGEVVDGINAPNIVFPYDGGFVAETDGDVQILGNGSMRVAVKVAHDGRVANLLGEVNGSISRALGGISLNKVTGTLRALSVGDARNAIDFSVFDLEGIGNDVDPQRAREILRGIHFAAMSVCGVYGATGFRPRKKATA